MSHDFELSCPNCGMQFRARDRWIGRTGRCQHCHHSFVVQAPRDRQATRRVAEGWRTPAVLRRPTVAIATTRIISMYCHDPLASQKPSWSHCRSRPPSQRILLPSDHGGSIRSGWCWSLWPRPWWFSAVGL